MGQLHSLKGNSGSTQGQQGPTRARFREVKCLHRLKKKSTGIFLVVQWLRLQAPNAGAIGARVRPLVGQTKIPCAAGHSPKKGEKKR